MSSWPGSYPSKRAYTYQPGSDFPTGSILTWDDTTPDAGVSIVIQIFGNANNPSAIPIREIYFPVILAPIAFYLGYQGIPDDVAPDYVTQGSGMETVDFDGVMYLTLAYNARSYAGSAIYVFARSLPTGAFRLGPVGAQVTSVTGIPPITVTAGNTPVVALQTPLATGFGGTGTETPQLIAGTGITITGTAFNWTISTSSSDITSIEADPAQSPAALYINDPTGPVVEIGLVVPVPIAYGGTGFTDPALTAGVGITITGNIFQPTGGSAWTIVNSGVTSAVPGTSGATQTGAVLFESKDGSLNITGDTPNNALNFELANPIGFTIAVSAKLNPATINASGETVSLPSLPSGTWFVEVIIHGWGFTGGGSGSDFVDMTAAGWEAAHSHRIRCKVAKAPERCMPQGLHLRGTRLR